MRIYTYGVALVETLRMMVNPPSFPVDVETAPLDVVGMLMMVVVTVLHHQPHV